MALEPLDWNVVVVGYWNPAILTPAGIAKRLFELQQSTPIMVEVPIDGLAPHRVRHDKITVTADPGRLVVGVDAPEFPLLERAMTIAARAITNLPETPFSAAGFNIRFRITEPPADLIRSLEAPVDSRVSDAGFAIELRQLKRTLGYKNGSLNLDLRQGKGGSVRVELNFHMQSSDRTELTAWLAAPIDGVRETTDRVLREVLGVIPEGGEA